MLHGVSDTSYWTSPFPGKLTLPAAVWTHERVFNCCNGLGFYRAFARRFRHPLDD